MSVFYGRKCQWIVLLLVLAAGGSGTYVFFSREEVKSAVPLDNTPASLSASFARIAPEPHAASVTVYGQAGPDWQTTLRSPVAGKVVYISHRLKDGMTVEKDQVLVRVDDTAYRSKLARAELTLADARLTLKKEEREAAQALENWQSSGLKGLPESDLVLRKPQVFAAQKQVDAAVAAMAAARKELAYCQIRSPFTGVILDRKVSLGQLLSHGDQITGILGTEKAVVEIGLDAKQWAVLGEDYSQIHVILRDESGDRSWQAVISRADHRIMPKSRLRRLFCEVENPLAQDPPLLSGTFLTITLTGKQISNLLKLPESTVTKQGVVWYKDEADRLNSFHARPVFYREGSVYIRPPRDISLPVHVALYPNNAFLNGRAVQPKTPQISQMNTKG